MSKPIHGYWNIRGLAGPTRNLLHYVGLDYEEKLYGFGDPNNLSMESWQGDKFNLDLPFPNVPYWIEKDTGIKLTESKAILKHIAREHAPELLPKTNAEHRDADQLENLIVDAQLRLAFMAFDYKEEAAGHVEQFAKDKFGYLTKWLDGKKWIMGQNMSYVDFLLYDMLYFYKSYKADILEPFSALLAYMKAFESVPAIAKYIASPEYIPGPCLGPLAKKQF